MTARQITGVAGLSFRILILRGVMAALRDFELPGRARPETHPAMIVRWKSVIFCKRDGVFADQPSTITMAPAVISAPPTNAYAFSFSPSSSQANTITSGTLNLSNGATRDAGPNCKARK